MSTTILGIESSCDDTSAAVISTASCEATSYQAKRTCGIRRRGCRNSLPAPSTEIVPTVSEALRQAGVKVSDLDAVAFTRGPGLLGSLPRWHLFCKKARHSSPDTYNRRQPSACPHTFTLHPHRGRPGSAGIPVHCLLVSGRKFADCHGAFPYDMEIAGRTIDDAAGEASTNAQK